MATLCANQLGNILRGDVVIEAPANEGVTHPRRRGMERVTVLVLDVRQFAQLADAASPELHEALVYVLAHETRHMR